MTNLKAPESRRLEYKVKLPTGEALARTIAAFANDAGGTLCIGVDDKTMEVVGIPDDELMATEEKISNTIHDMIYSAVIPIITRHGTSSEGHWQLKQNAEALHEDYITGNPAFDFLKDPAEDIYTLNDGKPVDYCF